MSSMTKTIIVAAVVSLAAIYLNNHDILPGFFKPSADDAGAGNGSDAGTAG